MQNIYKHKKNILPVRVNSFTSSIIAFQMTVHEKVNLSTKQIVP